LRAFVCRNYLLVNIYRKENYYFIMCVCVCVCVCARAYVRNNEYNYSAQKCANEYTL